MHMTNAVPRNTVIPYWNEIKNWSREDRSNLAALIDESLEEEGQTSGEEMDSFLNQLDENLIRRAAEFAHKQYLEGKCTTHSEVMGIIKEKMGWK